MESSGSEPRHRLTPSAAYRRHKAAVDVERQPPPRTRSGALAIFLNAASSYGLISIAKLAKFHDLVALDSHERPVVLINFGRDNAPSIA
jgi:hypothetical protein